MKIHTVWIRQFGECLPELVTVMDENGYDENPDYIHREIEKFKERDDIESVEYIVLKLTGLTWEKIQAIFNRPDITIEASAMVYPS